MLWYTLARRTGMQHIIHQVTIHISFDTQKRTIPTWNEERKKKQSRLTKFVYKLQTMRFSILVRIFFHTFPKGIGFYCFIRLHRRLYYLFDTVEKKVIPLVNESHRWSRGVERNTNKRSDLMVFDLLDTQP